MKHQTEIIRHIADLNMEDKHATVGILRGRTFIRREPLADALRELYTDGLIDWNDDLEIWLTESGWAQYERDKPRVVSADMLVSHADGGDV